MQKIKLLLSIILVVLCSTSHASLEEEIDAMTPDDARRVMAKLKGKMLEPIPAGFFTKMSVTLASHYGFADPQSFRDSLNSSFASEFEELRGYEVSVFWEVKENFRLGFGVGVIGQSDVKEVSSDLFHEASLYGMFAQLRTAYVYHLGERWLLMPQVGFGGTFAGASIETSNDSASTTHNFKYSGTSLSATVSAALMFKLNPIWTLGLEGGYFYSKTEELKRSGETEISSPGELDLSNPYIGFKMGINI